MRLLLAFLLAFAFTGCQINPNTWEIERKHHSK
jgi:hypothetical protein